MSRTPDGSESESARRRRRPGYYASAPGILSPLSEDVPGRKRKETGSAFEYVRGVEMLARTLAQILVGTREEAANPC